MDQRKPSILNIRTLLLVLLSLPVLAVSYYFVFALPAYNQAQLELEREKFKAEQNEKQRKEQAEAEAQRQRAKLEADTKAKAEGEKTLNEVLLSGCLADADTRYWSYVKLNGTEIPNQPGTYNAPRSVLDYADKQKKAALDECYRKYPR